MALPNAARLRGSVDASCFKTLLDPKGVEKRVNSALANLLRHAEELARVNFRQASYYVTVANKPDYDDARFIERLMARLIEHGFQASWEWSPNKTYEIRVTVRW